MKDAGNPFRMLWNKGYRRLCPITPPKCPVSVKSSFHRRIKAGDDARGKAPGVKWEDGSWSGFDFVNHESTEEDLARWHKMGAGAGIKTGRGLVLIDADTMNAGRAQIIKAEIDASIQPLPVRIGNAPKVGYLVRTDEDFQYTRIEFGERDAKGRLKDRVEILSEGRQFVAIGTHPGTGKPYHWPDNIPDLKDVPFASTELLHKLLDDLRPKLPAASEIKREGAPTQIDQRTLRTSIELLRKAVEATPNTSNHFPTRDAYRDYGYAIKAAAGPEHEAEALDIYQDWCARWQDGENDPRLVEADWSRMKPPFRRGASWIFDLAERYSLNGEHFAALQWAEQPDENAPLFPENSSQPSKDTRRFELITLTEAAKLSLTAAAKPLIKGLLDQGAMSVLYGESNSGKTFIAMDMAYHVSTGRNWGDKKTAQLPVLYIVAEGGLGAYKRADALVRTYETADDFNLIISPINLLRADADLKPLQSTIADYERANGRGFGLVVIDTLSRAMSGGDENASTDMGAMVKNLDVLRASSRSHVMAVHHTGKDRAKGARGHSLLRAATDTEIEVADGQIAVTKQRDMEGGFFRRFDLTEVVLGKDSDGDRVSSAVLRLLGEGQVVVGVATPRENDVLEAVGALCDLGSGRGVGVTVDEIRVFFDGVSGGMTVDTVRALLRKLLTKHLVHQPVRGRWAPREVTKDNLSSDPGAWTECQKNSLFD